MAIPPGITEQDFASALQEFANIVGEEWVFTSDEDTALYEDVYFHLPELRGWNLKSPPPSRRIRRNRCAGYRQGRQPVPGAALSHFHRQRTLG